MTRIEKLETEIDRIKQLVDELTVMFYNMGSLENVIQQSEALLSTDFTTPEERQKQIENLYNNAPPLEKMWMDIEALKGKVNKETLEHLKDYLKKLDIKPFNLN